MQLITIGVLTALTALLSLGSKAEASPAAGSILVAGMDVGAPTGSLAWAGENESFLGLDLASTDQLPEHAIDLELMTALAAPEPPAIVLAGMALGGVICGRSFLRKRSTKTPTETT